MLTSTLTPEEQRFFETGELQPGMTPQAPAPAPAPSAEPPFDPLAHAALNNAPAPAQPPAPAPAPAVQPPVQQEPSLDATEILRRSLAEAQQRVGALESYIQQVQANPPAPTTPATPAPNPEVDPLGAMMHQLEQVNKTVVELQTALNQQQTQQTQLTQFQQFQQRVQALRDEFVKTAPDFNDAYAHIRNARIADLRAYGLTDDKIQQALFQEEATLAENAIRFGRNPAEVIYEMSKRHGYQPKQVAAPATAPAQVPAPDAKLAAIQAAQAAARNLPKSMNPEDFTIEGLKEVGDADLNKIVMDEKLWSKIVGSDQHPI